MIRRLAKLHLECSSRIATRRDRGLSLVWLRCLERNLEGKISVGSVGGGIKVGSCVERVVDSETGGLVEVVRRAWCVSEEVSRFFFLGDF